MAALEGAMEQSDWAGVLAPGLDDIAALAMAARASLPPEFAAAAKDVAIRVEDVAPDALLDDLGIDNPLALSGLYEGVPLTQKSVMDPGGHSDVIWLFRRAIVDEWAARGDVTLDVLVTHVFVHELAHHLGWSDGDIAAIDRWWE
ncbi:metallopeptidase family protein [Thioclava arctica]|jgi:predicted Zn-dependent protease with MMP-like domain|uniref:metallopeptidase family protein n=1 Tax=Thioclava arctica TaxID=3238301 RepID=UPI003F5FDF4E